MRKVLGFLLALTIGATWAQCAKDVQIVTRTLPNGQNSVAYNELVRIKFGTKPYTCTQPSGTLPTGLALTDGGPGGSCVLLGTPSANGTFNFAIVVTDAAGSPTSDTRTYSVTIAGTAPITPVEITTTSLPSGTNDVAYSATLQATNGTTPYAWSVPSQFGYLPAGVGLNTLTGELSGTPTASGTYSFTARVTDANSVTSDRAFAVVVAAGSPTYIFSDPLDTNFAAWDFVWGGPSGTGTAIDTCPGGGNCAKFYYVICGDSTNPACGAAHQDSNRWVSKVINPGIDPADVRLYVYFKSPESGAAAYPMQRKILYMGDSLDPGTQGARRDSSGGWSAVLTSDSTASGITLRWTQNDSTNCGFTGVSYYPTGTLSYDTFYAIEVDQQLNTPGSADGVLDVLVGGVSKLHQTGVNFRGSCTTDMSFFSIGTQTDRSSYNVVEEYRYEKDVVIDDSGPIGP